MPVGNHQWAKQPEQSRINATTRKAELHAWGEITRVGGSLCGRGAGVFMSGPIQDEPGQCGYGGGRMCPKFP